MFWIILGIILLPACYPADAPRASATGTYIAFLNDFGRDPKKEPTALNVLDRSSGKTTQVSLPDRHSITGFTWVGDRLIAWSTMLKSLEPEGKRAKTASKHAFWTVDPTSLAINSTNVGRDPLHAPFAGQIKGKPCLLVPSGTGSVTKALSLSDLSEITHYPFVAMPAGQGWIYTSRIKRHPGSATPTLEAIEIRKPDGTLECHILSDDVARASYRGARDPVCARISEDQKQVLLGFGTETLFRNAPVRYTFGVFSTQSGKFLWKGDSNSLRGLPIFKNGSVYALESFFSDRDSGDRTVAALAEQTPQGDQYVQTVALMERRPEGARMVLKLSLGKGHGAARYSPSYDQKSFVLQVEGKAPKMLVIPVGREVSQKDVVEYRVR